MVKLRDGAVEQQHLPFRVGQFLSLVHDDVRERASEQVRVGVGQCGLVDQNALCVLYAQHRHHTFTVVGSEYVVDNPGHVFPSGVDGGVMPTLTS
jgi:hypothetical protein